MKILQNLSLFALPIAVACGNTPPGEPPVPGGFTASGGTDTSGSSGGSSGFSTGQTSTTATTATTASTTGTTTSTTSTTGGSSTGEDTSGCETSPCPNDDPGPGFCPGHAKFERGVAIWALYESPTGVIMTQSQIPSLPGQPDAVCDDFQSCCYTWSDPDSLPMIESNAQEQIFTACENAYDNIVDLVIGTGFPGAHEIAGQGRWDLVDYYCDEDATLNAGEVVTGHINGTVYSGGSQYEPDVNSCVTGSIGDNVLTDCTTAECEDCSTLYSTSVSYCDDWDPLNLTVTEDFTNKEMTVDVAATLSAFIATELGYAAYECEPAWYIGADMVFDTVSSGGLLDELDLGQYDKVTKVKNCYNQWNCKSTSKWDEMYDIVRETVQQGGTFTATIKRDDDGNGIAETDWTYEITFN